MFLFDNNFVIDIVTSRTDLSEKYSDIVIYCLKYNQAYLSTSQLHNLRFVFKKHYKDYYQDYLIFESKCKLVKTPSYVDFSMPLAEVDMDDYLIELSAKSINANGITMQSRVVCNCKCKRLGPSAKTLVLNFVCILFCRSLKVI